MPTAEVPSIFPFDDVHASGLDVHDPSIALIKGIYVLFATSRGDFTPMWTSRDRIHWKFEGPVLADSPAWLKEAVPQHTSVWAPAPLVIGSMLRVYYCASQKFGSNTSFIGMVETRDFRPDHPTQGWVDRGKLIESDAGKDNFNAIDPDVCIGPDQRQWMVYGSYWSGIYEVELDKLTGGVKAGATPLHVASNTADRGNPLEAPFLRYHKGFYYLFVTYGLAAQGVRSTYRTVVGRSKNPEGPFVGFDGTPMVDGGHVDLLKSSPPMFGPGGGNMFQDPQGEWWFSYHYYDSNRHWVRDMWGKPTLQIRKVVWGEDGWPLPGLPDGIELEWRTPATVAGKWTFQSDFADPFELELTGDGTGSSGTRKLKWIAAGDELTLEWQTNGDVSIDRLKLDPTKQFLVGRNNSGQIVRGMKLDAHFRKL